MASESGSHDILRDYAHSVQLPYLLPDLAASKRFFSGCSDQIFFFQDVEIQGFIRARSDAGSKICLEEKETKQLIHGIPTHLPHLLCSASPSAAGSIRNYS
jgi:hypothetical protein